METRVSTKYPALIGKTKPPQIYHTDESGISTTPAHAATNRMEVFTCIAYKADNQTLCGGTNQGNLYTWKRTSRSNYSVDMPENGWQLNNISAVRGAIKQCSWGFCDNAKPCVLLNCVSNVYILKVNLCRPTFRPLFII